MRKQLLDKLEEELSQMLQRELAWRETKSPGVPAVMQVKELLQQLRKVM